MAATPVSDTVANGPKSRYLRHGHPLPSAVKCESCSHSLSSGDAEDGLRRGWMTREVRLVQEWPTDASRPLQPMSSGKEHPMMCRDSRRGMCR
eukprot:1158048-Pelagomonas_calceolata.AAC.5